MSAPTCSVCQKAATLPALICTMCTTVPTYYCDTNCRGRHQTQELVYRCGGLLKELLLAFREAAFDIKIKGVEKIGNKLLIYEDWYDLKDPNEGPLYRFPGHMFDDDSDKSKLLVFCACQEAVAFTFELAETLLRDISATIEEINVDNVDRNSTIVKYVATGRMDGVPYGHNAMIVETKPELGGKSYAFDLAGAQNGQLNAVVPFHEFANKAGEVVSEIHPHGYCKDMCKKIRDGTEGMPETHDHRSSHMQYEIAQRMLAAVKEWEGINKTKLQRLVRSKSDAFVEGKASLIAHVSSDLLAYVVKWEQDGRYIKPFTPLEVPWAMSFHGPKVEECTVEPKGLGSQAYRRFLADKKRRGRFPESMKEFTNALGQTFKFVDLS
ncbi:hypothetical protein PRZ48_007490 [Zasmidium cellare]|uniref:MYND-type zinc finger protein samB n=1 Tax=Zasmidium cellare TaxID=395010 RepID=A0ABR0EKJ6_ZASCE|nr:hypothetical protein PRZ48_007490 [Zasmidium cellare]